MITYGPWRPDDPDYTNRGLITATNAIPTSDGYRSFPSIAVYSSALDLYCRGAGNFRDSNGNVYNYAGTADKLYSLTTATYGDVSLAGGYSMSTNERWEFARFGDVVIAVDNDDYPQSITMGGANFANLTTLFKCRHIAVVRGFVFAGNTWDSTDGYVPHRVRWSANEDHTDWTYSTTTQSDYQDFPDDGWVQAIVSGEYATIFQEHAITRGTYVGGSLIFQFDKLEQRGTPASGSVIKVGRDIYYLSWNGFYVLRGDTSIPIGAEKIDKWFDADLDKSYYHRITSTVDPINHLVMWSYPGSGSSGGTPNKILLYHWVTGEWGVIEQTHEMITSYYSPGYTLEQLDSFGTMDTLPYSLDSPVWQGGTLTLAAFDSNHKLNNFSGTAMSATFETSEFQLFPNRKGTLREIRPRVDGTATHTITVATRNEQSDTESYGSTLTAAPSGRYNCRSTAFFHRIKDITSGSFDRAIGIDIKGIQRGKR